MINAMVGLCKDYPGSPEEGKQAGRGEGDDGGSSGKSLENLTCGRDAIFMLKEE